MSQNLTINGEAVSASQQGPLAVEEFLQENYLFRNNVLSGKVEFLAKPSGKAERAIVPYEGEPKYRVLTQEALNRVSK
jgi:hypothetical protein